MTMSAEHRSKFAALHQQCCRLHMSEKFSSGTLNFNQTNKLHLFMKTFKTLKPNKYIGSYLQCPCRSIHKHQYCFQQLFQRHILCECTERDQHHPQWTSSGKSGIVPSLWSNRLVCRTVYLLQKYKTLVHDSSWWQTFIFIWCFLFKISYKLRTTFWIVYIIWLSIFGL